MGGGEKHIVMLSSYFYLILAKMTAVGAIWLQIFRVDLAETEWQSRCPLSFSLLHIA
jgi:hypothetical protein